MPYRPGESGIVLNKFFISIFTVDEGEASNCENIPGIMPLTHVEVTIQKIKEGLNKQNATKSSGSDSIHPRLLKETVDTFSECVVPTAWKMVNISPIYKNGGKWKLGSYRPVSFTAICCKLLESIIRQNLVEHMTSKDLLMKHQHDVMHHTATVCT